MPLIQINIVEGRSPEKKERLIREVSDLVAEVLEAPVENVRVMIQEMSPEHWGIAGESVKKRAQKNNSVTRYNKIISLFSCFMLLLILSEMEEKE